LLVSFLQDFDRGLKHCWRLGAQTVELISESGSWRVWRVGIVHSDLPSSKLSLSKIYFKNP
jgi:hypothetical protein